MATRISTFLIFEGQAEEAMNFYISLFNNSEIKSIRRYEENEGEETGKVLHGIFSLNGEDYLCTDSTENQDSSFTSSMSLFVNCETEQEIDHLFEHLSTGKILMALDSYGFSKKYGWVEDKFGVSWQFFLASE